MLQSCQVIFLMIGRSPYLEVCEEGGNKIHSTFLYTGGFLFDGKLLSLLVPSIVVRIHHHCLESLGYFFQVT